MQKKLPAIIEEQIAANLVFGSRGTELGVQASLIAVVYVDCPLPYKRVSK